MSQHSDRFLKLREAQRLSERSLRESIDEESKKLEDSALGFLKVGGASIMLASIGYLAFRAIGGSKNKKLEVKKRKKDVKKKASINNTSWLEPVLLLIAKNGLNLLVDQFNRQRSTKETKK